MVVKKKKTGKKVIKKKAAKKVKKILVHPVKSRKTGILAKPKLFNRVKKTKKPKKLFKFKAKKKTVLKKKPTAKKIIKKSAKPKAIKRTRKIPQKKTKSFVKLRAKKRAAKVLAPEFPAEALFKARIKVVGLGGGGGSIVSEIGRSLEKATFVIADTDMRALKKREGIKSFLFGENLTHGLGTGVNPELAKQAAEEVKEKMAGIFEGQDIVIFIASLGGGLGSGATQVFAQAAKEFGGITVGIFTLPFKFEGKNKSRIALGALKALKQSLNVSLVIPNEKIFKIIDVNTPITEAFSTVNKSLTGALESLIDLIYNPGIINIDFADLKTILKGRGNQAFLNTVEESGKNRAEKICEKVFVNPLLQNNNFEAEKILFNIAGSESLSMFEVEKVSRHIADLNPKAKIIFGISKNAKLKNKIKTTILMTGGAIKEASPVKKAEPVEAVVKKEVEKKSVEKKPKIPKNNKKIKKNKNKEQKPVSFIPVFEVPVPSMPIVEQNKISIVETIPVSSKKTIRRSGLEIKKAEELQEKKRQQQEKEWEIPAFLRRVKFKS